MTLVRAPQPIWQFRDHTGQPLDDTYYAFFLQNEIPYLPRSVFHDQNGDIPWTNPLQLSAAGTLPNNLYFENDVYRIEIRRGNTQADELIWLIQNFDVAGAAAPGALSVTTDNQVFNPQFVMMNFDDDFDITTSGTYEIAPGWAIVTAGSGALNVSRVALSSTTQTPTNAPYVLKLEASGAWTSIILRQRFAQNGMLWANKYVSSSLTARLTGAPNVITTRMIDSEGNVLQTLMAPTITSIFTEFTGVGLLPESVNEDVPPDAYIEYQIIIPANITLFISSIQLLSSDISATFGFEQETVEEQTNKSFHYYKDAILLQPKESLLTGWDFRLNPWQFHPRDMTTATFASRYVADQTVILQQNYVAAAVDSNVDTGRINQYFSVQARTNSNKFAMVQFVDNHSVSPYWGAKVSALVKLYGIKKVSDSALKFKMILFYREGATPANTQTNPIVSWASDGEPVLASGWTKISASLDPSYSITNSVQEYAFNGFQLPSTGINELSDLGIMVYTLDNMDAAVTADSIVFQQISLVPNEFAMDCNVLTFDETLRRCQLYWESSYPFPINSGSIVSAITNGRLVRSQHSQEFNNQRFCVATSFSFEFQQYKRAIPTVTLINPYGTTGGTVAAFIQGGTKNSAEVSSSNWTQIATKMGVSKVIVAPVILLAPDDPNIATAWIEFHYIADARIGV